MNISAIFIRRPVTTTLVMVAILLAGLVGYKLLPVSDLPNVDFPTISVSASLPGASPETMASSVATPLERQFSTIAGIDQMTSNNTLGSTSITITFALSRNIDAAAQDVQAAISQVLGQLPQDMPSPPTFRKANPADQPIIYLALGSPVLPLSKVNEFADTMIGQRISMIDGVAQVQIFGSQKYAVRVQVDPKALVGHDIGIDEVASAIRNNNVNVPVGTLNGPNQSVTIKATGQLTTANDYRPMIVAWRNGAPIRLSDLGRVTDSVENDQIASWFNNTRAIVLAIQRQPGTNTVEIVDAIKKLLPTFRAQMPAAVNLDILFDRSQSIRASVHDVQFTLCLTIGLVILIIFAFLRSLTATIIPSLSLPMSIIGTFAVMNLLKFNLDNLSLMALTLSVGFVVDDAIVMLENIVRHREMGKGPMEAALAGSAEVSFTILSMTISLVAVFIPVLFMGGLIGRLLNEFALTISVAILISGIVALTLIPMLCSRFLRAAGSQKHGHIYDVSEAFFNGLLKLYEVTLRLSMRHRWVMMGVLAFLFYQAYYLFTVMPSGFLPSEDAGRLSVITEGPQGVSFEEMARHQQTLADIVAKDSNVDSFMSTVTGTNQGRMFLRLKDPAARAKVNGRPMKIEEIVQQLRPKLGKVPGIRAFPLIPPTIQIGGMQSKSLYQYTLQCPDTAALYQYAPQLETKVKALPGLTDVASDLYNRNPQVNVVIDRDKAAQLGLTASQIEDALFSAYGARQISTFYLPTNAYRVILQLEPEAQLDPSKLSMLYIHSASGQLVPLETFVTLTRNVGPLSVNHLSQQPSVTISFNLKPGYSLSNAVQDVGDVAKALLPPTISTSFQGTAQVYQASTKTLPMLLVLAVLVIYIVLGILYESFIHPLTILSGLPAAGVGALLTLRWFGAELNLYSFVGIIMLIGIVKKNAIMMIDFALEAQRKEGKAPAEAIFEGCLVRFRPIMMTTMAAMMGGIPIALGMGAGGDARRPLGLAIVGGLIVSQFLTLYITPVLYTYMEGLRRFFSPRQEEPQEIVQPREREVVLES